MKSILLAMGGKAKQAVLDYCSVPRYFGKLSSIFTKRLKIKYNHSNETEEYCELVRDRKERSLAHFRNLGSSLRTVQANKKNRHQTSLARTLSDSTVITMAPGLSIRQTQAGRRVAKLMLRRGKQMQRSFLLQKAFSTLPSSWASRMQRGAILLSQVILMVK